MNYGAYFSEKEFICSHTGKVEMDQNFLDRLNELRGLYGKSLRVTSGFRDVTHPIEARKKTPGAHTTGQAADLAVRGADAYKLLEIALSLKFSGIGVAQKGSARFIHLDTLITTGTRPRPTVWSY
ncbi:MAG: peptidase M15 [Flavobacteriaceae bacterium]|nr:peptidase M15 [Flavobacteriaceae bacterium]